MYPKDWPKCPGCGEPALDGHITCGKLKCDERAARVIREQTGARQVHILIEGQALCGKPGPPGQWRDGHRWARWEERSEATCDACLSAAWKRQAHSDPKVPDEGTDERKNERPAGRVDEGALDPVFRALGAELLRALFAWRDQASSITRWTTKPSRKLAHLADQLARLYPDATAELRWAGRFDAIEASMKRIQSLQTPKGRARELLRIREDLATMGNDVEAIAEHAADAAEEEKDERPEGRKDEGTVVQSLHSAGDVLLARFLLANPKKLPSTTTVLELMEWSNAQPRVPLLGNPLPRTRELLRRFANDWRESEKDPANGGGKINVDLLTEVCDAFEAEDRGE
jgi:hypothetical protein